MRIIIADDHPLYLDAAKQQLQRAFKDAEVVSATRFSEVCDRLEDGPADIVLVDFSMPGNEKLSGLKKVIAAARDTPVFVISGVAIGKDVEACIAAGARSFLPKTLDGQMVTAAIKLALRHNRSTVETG
jgi:two-component system, NarL family, nitrate/nitrite response regulator NarL